MSGLPEPMVTFLWCALAAGVTHSAMRALIGPRADRAAPPTVLISLIIAISLSGAGPWWSVMSGGVVGYASSVCGWWYMVSRKMPRWLLNIAMLATMGQLVGTYVTMFSLVNEVMDVTAKASAEQWERFAGRGDAQRFVADNYRPCIESSTAQHVGSGRSMSTVIIKNDPLACRANAVTVARAARGEEFATRVEGAISDWEHSDRELTGADAERVQKAMVKLGADASATK